MAAKTAPTPDADDLEPELEPAAAPESKLRQLTREQLGANLRRNRDRRLRLEAELDDLRQTVGDGIAAGHLAGWTYEQLAELTGLSRARVAQVLAAKRDTEPVVGE